MVKHINTALFIIWTVWVSFYLVTFEVFRFPITLYKISVYLLPTLLLLLEGNFFLKSLISALLALWALPLFFVFGLLKSTHLYQRTYSSGDEMGLMFAIGMFALFCLKIALIGLVVGWVNKLIVKKIVQWEIDIKSHKRDLLLIIPIIFIGVALIKTEQIKIYLPMNKETNIPHYEIQYYRGHGYGVFFENGFAIKSTLFQKEPTDAEIKSAYIDRRLLVATGPIVDKTYKRYGPVLINIALNFINVYVLAIGYLILLLGYPALFFGRVTVNTIKLKREANRA